METEGALRGCEKPTRRAVHHELPNSTPTVPTRKNRADERMTDGPMQAGDESWGDIPDVAGTICDAANQEEQIMMCSHCFLIKKDGPRAT